MKKFNLFMIALISMFAFSLGVNAKDVATKDDLLTAFAGTDEVITLTSDIALTAPVEVTRNVTLDLNGHKISADTTFDADAADYMFGVHRKAHLTIKDSGTDGIITNSGKLLTVVKLTLKGENDPTYPAKITLNGGTLKDEYAGEDGYSPISGNGDRHNVEITINGGKVIAKNIHGIYLAPEGKLTVNDGYIEGATGIEVRAGELNISGGTIVGTGSTYSVTANGSGQTTFGAAVAVVQHTTKKDVKVTITGGTFKGVVAFSEANPQNNSEADLDKIVLSITGGDFTTTDTSSTATPVVSEDKDGFITGGTYNGVLEDEYLKDDFEVSIDANGNTIVLDASGLYDWYERLLDLDEEDYTETSVKALEDYMDSLGNMTPKSQEELDAIVAKLNELTDALETPEEEKARLEREEAEKKANEDKKTNNPDTGDSIYLYVGILTISALAIGALALNRRKSYR